MCSHKHFFGAPRRIRTFAPGSGDQKGHKYGFFASVHRCLFIPVFIEFLFLRCYYFFTNFTPKFTPRLTPKITAQRYLIHGSGPYSRSMPARVTSQIRPAFLASSGVNRGFPPLYPVQACWIERGFIPHFSAASAAVITSSNGFISSPP
jgi:hypothetical protein